MAPPQTKTARTLSSTSSSNTADTLPRLSECSQTVFQYGVDREPSANYPACKPCRQRGRPRLCSVLVGIFVAVVVVILGAAFGLWYLRENDARDHMLTGCHEVLDKFWNVSSAVIDPLIKELAYKDILSLKLSILEFLETPRRAVEMLEYAMEESAGLVTLHGLHSNAKYMWTVERHFACHQKGPVVLENIYYADYQGLFMGYTNLCVDRQSPRCGLDWRYGFDLAPGTGNLSQYSAGSLLPMLEQHQGQMNVGYYVVREETGEPVVSFGHTLYDPRTRPWYQRAVRAMGMTTWTQIYESKLGGDGSHPNLGFAVSRAHFEGDRPLMVAGATVTLNKLTELLEHHNPKCADRLTGVNHTCPGSHLFIVDIKGRMVASSKGPRYVHCHTADCRGLQLHWNHTGCPAVLSAVSWLMRLHLNNLERVTTCDVHVRNESGEIFSWAPLRSGPQKFGLSWIAIFVQPLSSYNGKVSTQLEENQHEMESVTHEQEVAMEHARWFTIGGCVIIMIVGAFLLACIAWQVTRPLNIIARDMNAVAKLELERVDNLLHEAERGGAGRNSMIREVAQIRDSFADMASGLRSFTRYMDPYVVQVLLQSQRQAKLGVARADVTIFFSDIADFTTITERVAPPIFLDMLSEYMDRMSEIIMGYHGVVGEFIGDGIMAWWNVPCDLGTRHTVAALSAALAQQQALSELRPLWCSRGLPEVRARMGLARGQVYAGNIGSENRMKFGLVGDKVNLASRLESLCKRYCVAVLIDGEAAEAPNVEREFFLRTIDVVVVKGRSEVTELFELVAHKSSVMGTSLQMMYERYCSDFAQVHFYYRRQDFGLALELLGSYLTSWPSDHAAQLMKQRCEALIEKPPGEDWSYVEKLSEK